MMTKLSMWLTYIASCNAVYLLQFISHAYFSYVEVDSGAYPTILCKLVTVLNEGKWLFIVLIALILFSTLWNTQWSHVRGNTRIKYRPEMDHGVQRPQGLYPFLMAVSRPVISTILDSFILLTELHHG